MSEVTFDPGCVHPILCVSAFCCFLPAHPVQQPTGRQQQQQNQTRSKSVLDVITRWKCQVMRYEFLNLFQLKLSALSNTAEVTRNNFDQKHGNSILLTYATLVKANPWSFTDILSSEIG